MDTLLILLLGSVLGAVMMILLFRKRIRFLKGLAETDPLTGALNFRAFSQKLAALDKHSGQHTVILIDLDNFKHINDQQGYHAGDAVLKEFSDFLQQHIRVGDQVFRYRQGDEFALLLRTDLKGAEHFAERIECEARQRAFGGMPVGAIHFSYGLSPVHIAEDRKTGETAWYNLQMFKARTKPV